MLIRSLANVGFLTSHICGLQESSCRGRQRSNRTRIFVDVLTHAVYEGCGVTTHLNVNESHFRFSEGNLYWHRACHFEREGFLDVRFGVRTKWMQQIKI